MAETAPPGLAAVLMLGRFNGMAGLICRNIAAILIALMTSAVLIGVFFRYVLNDSLPWTEDASILMMIWVAFLIAPWAYRAGGHVAIELFSGAMPEVMRRIVQILVNLLVLWILYRFFFEAIVYVERGWTMRANTVPVPIAWFRMIVPVSYLLMFLVGVELIARDLLSLFDRNRNYDLPHVSGTVEPE